MVLAACNRGETIERVSPSIAFDNGTGVYETKIGRGVTIAPVVENAADAKYTWTLNGKLVSEEASYTFEIDTPGEYFLTFGVRASNGTAREDIRIDVLELMPPRVSLPVSAEGCIRAVAGRTLTIEPAVVSFDEPAYVWMVDGAEVSTAESLEFRKEAAGDHEVSLTVTNEDGVTTVDAVVRVVDTPTVTVRFAAAEMSVPAGRTLCIAPIVRDAQGEVACEWHVDGVRQDGNGLFFGFAPEAEGRYEVRVVANDGAAVDEATVTVRCEAPENTYYRAAGAASSTKANKVYEFTPAPGQFINRGYTAATPQQACAWAEGQLADGNRHVSLGGFGGYIVAGFDHSVSNTGEYDFAVDGNAFTGSSEPGIVWVMQDENGDGLPNDTWYELKGSEAGRQTTRQDYEVTYYKPSSERMPVLWSDSEGHTGRVDYLGVQKEQRSYYPQWITAESYTLRGTCLGLRNVLDPESGLWQNRDYEWGYADNYGSDRDAGELNHDAGARPNYFKISNAVHADGSAAGLRYIDFVKVQTGVNAKSGGLGEISTEVFGIRDINM